MIFVTPWILLGLLGLPLLWVILRAVPPSPTKVVFGGLALLLGLKDETQSAAHTPWWLILLRVLTVAAFIIGFAGPMLGPTQITTGSSRLVVVVDNGWMSDANRISDQKLLDDLWDQAIKSDQLVAILDLSDPQPLLFTSANDAQTRQDILSPLAVIPDFQSGLQAVQDSAEAEFDTLWLSDGVAYQESRATLLRALSDKGTVRYAQSARPYYLNTLERQDQGILVGVTRLDTTANDAITIEAYGTDLKGRNAVLAQSQIMFTQDSLEADTLFTLRAEVVGRVIGFRVAAQPYAASHRLAPSNLRQREIGLIGAGRIAETDALLDPYHYLERALGTDVRQIRAGLTDVIRANPDAIIMTDATAVPDPSALENWLSQGGNLIRFAGPSLASETVNSLSRDPFLPVTLRPGGRSLGGAMTWGDPKRLSPFASDSPFYGLEIPDDLRVYAQVLAQPSPDLDQHVIARLQDGTPLVTRRSYGSGQVVLFHVSANADWSNLPISELFLDMLERLSSPVATDQDFSTAPDAMWRPMQVMTGQGQLIAATDYAGVRGAQLGERRFTKDFLPGLYVNDGKVIALNHNIDPKQVTPMVWPADVLKVQDTDTPPVELGRYFIALGLIGLVFDGWVMAFVFSAAAKTAMIGLFVGVVMSVPNNTRAQDAAFFDSRELVLAHVITGNKRVDDMAQAGLFGLTETLFFRTSVEPGAPRGVDVERDELGVYPFLYWPITPEQAAISDAAYDKLNSYLATGGVILFDTRDADIASGKVNNALSRLSEKLTIPKLEPVPVDHVLTRAFYLLDAFPGRHATGELWVEAALDKGPQSDGIPFRSLNDGVSPVLIGGNDWASAWAMRENGDPLLPVGAGFSGDRQREMAYRFGVNLIMYVLTGNYKSDQVHVPALLERLGTE